MTWTFDSADLSTDLAKVRLTIGDTDTDDQLLTDEIIAMRLTQSNDSVDLASIACVRDILAQLSRHQDRSTTGFSSSRSQKVTHYRELLADLESSLNKQAMYLATPIAGGISKDDKDSEKADTDRVNPFHERGEHDNYGTSGNDDGWAA